jgi:Cu(I)/Ag(I) efflux system membrane fusion protein/cobalt-zinc-cadmium efflux system membrane fusion protein
MTVKKNTSLFMTIFLTALVTLSVTMGAVKFFARAPLAGSVQTGPGQAGIVQPGADPAAAPVGQQGTPVREAIYWRAPMDAMEIYDEPGKSKMGMDLVPVFADEAAGDPPSSERTIVYWKAPMDPTEIYERPGKSRMGMDLVPVYEDELVGGVDIRIDPVVEQNMGVRIEIAQKGVLNHTINTYGHITYDETRTGIVSQKAGGWIERLYADYTGFFVEKGQVLYEIYSPSLLASQEEYLSVYQNYQRNKSALNKELLASARKRLTYFDIADTEIAAIEQSGAVQKSLKIRSPFKGVVTEKNVFQGTFVKPGASLFTISDLAFVWVEAHIFEYEQNRVHEGQRVAMTLSYQPDKVYTGKIAYIFPYLQPKTRDVVIRIEFENTDMALKPDMFAKIEIMTGSDQEGVIIPSEAVIHSGAKKLVFVARGQGKFSPRKITTGIHLDGGRVEVLTGLAQGEAVVVSGQFLLDSESKLREAIQKMIEVKSAPKKAGSNQTDLDPADSSPDDDFFDDMESRDDFFKDME